MSFQSAYSLELKQYVTPKEAFDFSCSPIGTPNHLTDAKMFQCGENCSFKLTLANFNNPGFNKTPYFTPGARNQRHDPNNCQRMIEHYQQREQEVMSENHISFYREKNKLIIDLDLIKGVLATVTKPRQKDEANLSSESNRAELHHQSSHSSCTDKDNKTFRSHVKQLRDLVNYFLEYQSGEKYTFYNKHKIEIQLENHFVNLKEANQRGINLEEVHIYYDTATVKSIDNEENPEKSYFLVRFHSRCTIGDVSNCPSILINKNTANHHGVKGRLKILEKAAKDKQPLKLFYFGKFVRHSSNKYINPDVSQEAILDYLVIS